jgi:acid phosphatase
MRRALLLALLSIGLVAAPTLAKEPKAPAPPDQVNAYKASGQWDKDIDAIVAKAQATVDKAVRNKTKKPALIFDIDDTLLSSYACTKADNFSAGSRAACVVAGKMPAIPQTKKLYKSALKKKIAIFLVTGRPEGTRAGTIANLNRAGLAGFKGLAMRPNADLGKPQVAYKSGERKKVQDKGYTLIGNVGDQTTDLQGGFGKGFKIPNPMYFTP